LSTYYIPYIISIYKFIYPPNDNINGKKFFTLNEYFLRELDIGKILVNKTIIPCYGVIKDIGIIKNKTLYTQIKGETIKINSEYKKYINIFIKSNNYQFIHSPINGKITYITSYDGIRSLLIPYNINKLNLSIINNTKIIIQIQNKKTKIMIIMIGGLYIGSIQLFVRQNLEVKVGDKIGYFNFGNYVLLLHNENNITCKLHDNVNLYDSL